MTTDTDALIRTPFGAVAIAVHGEQLAVELLGLVPCGIIHVEKPSISPLVRLACQQIVDYLNQPTTILTLPVAQYGTLFQQRVWQAIAQIPCGETRTYGELASQIGSGPRAVANACGANKLPLLIPCHRVVAKGGIGGFMQGKQNGLQIKEWLLRHEGVHLGAVRNG